MFLLLSSLHSLERVLLWICLIWKWCTGDLWKCKGPFLPECIVQSRGCADERAAAGWRAGRCVCERVGFDKGACRHLVLLIWGLEVKKPQLSETPSSGLGLKIVIWSKITAKVFHVSTSFAPPVFLLLLRPLVFWEQTPCRFTQGSLSNRTRGFHIQARL